MDVSGSKHSYSCFKATDLESEIWLNSFKASGFEANEGSASLSPAQSTWNSKTKAMQSEY